MKKVVKIKIIKVLFLLFLFVTKTNLNAQNYQNYDFVPGNNLLFEDDFLSDVNGEWAKHWDLISGQGAVAEYNNEKALIMTDNFRISPLIKNNNYLTDNFSVEFDAIVHDEWGSWPLLLIFSKDENTSFYIHFANNEIRFSNDLNDKNFLGSMNIDIEKKHHFAIAFINKQVKVYVDDKRILSVPNAEVSPKYFAIDAGVYDGPKKIIHHLRVAEGAQMNLLNAISTNGKIISYGITFDINKSTLKPESMGTINQIFKLMKENPTLKFEIGGHTDSDGSDASNLALSQQRADMVMKKLIGLGIETARLTAVGYGKSKPIADNKTFEGKAKNRRVEFVKK